MKLAISIPDAVFVAAESMVKEAQTSRSHLYARALEEYIARHAPEQVTLAMDQAVEAVGQESASFRRRAARRVLENSEW